jgi:hypothetical protein
MLELKSHEINFVSGGVTKELQLGNGTGAIAVIGCLTVFMTAWFTVWNAYTAKSSAIRVAELSKESAIEVAKLNKNSECPRK